VIGVVGFDGPPGLAGDTRSLLTGGLPRGH
jgi:hypothetical protein